MKTVPSHDYISIKCVALWFSQALLFIYLFIHYYLWQHNFRPHFLLLSVLGCIIKIHSSEQVKQKCMPQK